MTGGKCKCSICVYGCSNSGKTHQVGELAEYVYAKTGKITRLVSADPGGWGSIEDKVEAGLIVPTYIRFRPHPYEAMNKLSKGYWPEDVNDPESKLLSPEHQSKEELANVGGWACDGITAVGALLMGYSVEQEASGKMRISGQQAAARFMDGAESFGAPSMSMYGTIQNYIAQYVAQSSALNGWYVMWTALEKKGAEEETETKLPLYGPEIIGNAKTSASPAWFNNMLHLHLENRLTKSKDDKAGLVRKMYTTTHWDERTKLPYLAKNTAPAKYPLPQVLEGEEVSVGHFLRLFEESKEKSLADVKKRMQERSK